MQFNSVHCEKMHRIHWCLSRTLCSYFSVQNTSSIYQLATIHRLAMKYAALVLMTWCIHYPTSISRLLTGIHKHTGEINFCCRRLNSQSVGFHSFILPIGSGWKRSRSRGCLLIHKFLASLEKKRCTPFMPKVIIMQRTRPLKIYLSALHWLHTLWTIGRNMMRQQSIILLLL